METKFILFFIFYTCKPIFFNLVVLPFNDYRMARRVLMAEVSGGRVRGRPRLGWMDGVKVALGNRGMTVEGARKTGKSGEPWYICN